jgi:nucleotide-binding universal stress UspA family protein
MKNILFPTAYSVQSKVAYRYTQKLAQYFGASITLLHVYKSVSPIIGEVDEATLIEIGGYDYNALEDKRWEAEVDKLKDFALEMSAKQFENIPVDFIATSGNVVNEILEINDVNQFDLIVMGMRKRTTTERLFGNTTYSIFLEEINCPILFIPPTAHYLGMDKIIYGTAFQIGEESAIEHLFDWCEAFDSTLHLLHIHQKTDKPVAQLKMNKLMVNYKTETEAGFMTAQLLEGNIKEAMELYIDFTGADLLAIHRRKKGFWQRIQKGSLTNILMEDSMIPLLILQ